MKRPRLTSATCVLAALFMMAAGDQQPAVPLIDLSFPGGSALDYVAALRKAASEANVVVDPEAAGITMPPVALKRVTVPAALDLLNGKQRSAEGGMAIQLLVRHVETHDPEERPTYQVMAQAAGRLGRPAPERAAHVWTVSSLLAGDLTSRKLLSAVELALDVVGPDTKPDVRFHEDTGLLIASGAEAQIKAIDSVIDQLGESAKQQRNEAMHKLQDEVVETRKRVEQQINELVSTNARLSDKLKECQDRASQLEQALRAREMPQEPKAGERRPPGG